MSHSLTALRKLPSRAVIVFFRSPRCGDGNHSLEPDCVLSVTLAEREWNSADSKFGSLPSPLPACPSSPVSTSLASLWLPRLGQCGPAVRVDVASRARLGLPRMTATSGEACSYRRSERFSPSLAAQTFLTAENQICSMSSYIIITDNTDSEIKAGLEILLMLRAEHSPGHPESAALVSPSLTTTDTSLTKLPGKR